VLLCAEDTGLLGGSATLSHLCQHLQTIGRGRERVKAYLGVLDTVNSYLQQYHYADPSDPAGTPLTQDDLAPFVVAGMEDALGPRVRSIAVSIAVEMRALFGPNALEPVLKDLRPALQSVLRDKIAEFNDNGTGCVDQGGVVDFAPPSSEIMASLVVCGRKIQSPEPDKGVSPLPPGMLPARNTVEDDAMMDCILEDTGHVFKGHAMPLQRRSSRTLGNKKLHLRDGETLEFLELDEELHELGLGVEDLEGWKASPFKKSSQAVEVF